MEIHDANYQYTVVGFLLQKMKGGRSFWPVDTCRLLSEMFIKENDLKINEWQFSQRKYLPWETKLQLTKTRIQEWHENWGGQVYLSYSGGLDSTVLLHLIRMTLGEEIPAVFSNTGLEFPEIVRFARKAPGALMK